jgi:hypothetical protein
MNSHFVTHKKSIISNMQVALPSLFANNLIGKINEHKDLKMKYWVVIVT